MSQPGNCPKCGSPIRPDAQFCPYCGNQLTPASSTPSAPAQPSYSPPSPPSPYAYDYQPGYAEVRKWIDWTKTGLLILLIGIIVGVIPIVSFIGTILAIIGAILVILGRKAFGEKHSKYVLVSVVIYVLGFIVIIAVTVGFVLSIVASARSGVSSSVLIRNLSSSINNFVYGVAIAAAITGLAYVFFTYAIQDNLGHILLWTAYSLSLIFAVAILSIVTPQIAGALSSAISSVGYNPAPVRALQAQISGLGLLNLIPNALYAIAYYLLYAKINRGEIPAGQQPQTPTSPTL